MCESCRVLRPTLCESRRALPRATSAEAVASAAARNEVLPELRAGTRGAADDEGGAGAGGAGDFSVRLAADGTRCVAAGAAAALAVAGVLLNHASRLVRSRPPPPARAHTLALALLRRSYLRRSGVAATRNGQAAAGVASALRAALGAATNLLAQSLGDPVQALVPARLRGEALDAKGAVPAAPPLALHPSRLALALARPTGDVAVYDLQGASPPAPAAEELAGEVVEALLSAREAAAEDGGSPEAFLEALHAAAARLASASVEGCPDVAAAADALGAELHALGGAGEAARTPPEVVCVWLQDALLALSNAALGLRAPATLASALQADAAALAWRPAFPGTLAVGCKAGVALWKGLEAGWGARGAGVRHSATAGGGETMALLQCGGHSSVCALAWGPCGQRLTSGGGVGSAVSVVVWDTSSREPHPLWRRAGPIGVLRWSPGGDYLFAAPRKGRRFRVWHTDSWEAQTWSGGHGAVRDAAWSPDGGVLLMSLERTAPVAALHFTRGPPSLEAQLLPVELPAAPGDDERNQPKVRSLAWDAAGERLAASLEGGRVLLFSSRLDPVLSLSLVGEVVGPRAALQGDEAAAAPVVAMHSAIPMGGNGGDTVASRTLAVAYANGSVMLVPLAFSL